MLLADRLRALGQDRPEALGRALEDAERAVEGVGEAGGGSGQGDRGELAGERDVELGELGLERAVEVRRVRAAVGQRRLAVDLQPVRAEEVGDEQGQLARVLGRAGRRAAEPEARPPAPPRNASSSPPLRPSEALEPRKPPKAKPPLGGPSASF